MLEKFIQLNNSQFGIRKRLTNEGIKNLILVLKMKNPRRLALVAGIALSAVAVSPKAQAQTTNVDFTGTIPATCTINSTTPGILDKINANQYVADGFSPANTGGVGTAGIINLSCNAGTTFTVTSVSDNGGTVNFSTATGTNAASDKGVTIRDAATGTTVSATTINTAGSVIPGPISNKNYAVQLNLFKTGTAFPVGTYNVRAVITLAPQ